MIPSHSDLVYFLEVTQTRNVSRAAERLGVSQPTVSLAIKRIEESLGVPVLIRNRSGVEPTRAGTQLVSRARALVQDWEEIRASALKDDTEIGGVYTVGCHPSVALYSLPVFLPRLLAEHPRLEVRLSHDLSRRVAEDVISFKTDFGIVVNPPRHPDLVITELFTDEVSLWTGRANKATAATQDARGGQGVLVCDPELLQTQELLRQLGKHGLKFARTVTSPRLEVIASLVAAGGGVGILPARVAQSVPGLVPLAGGAPRFHDKICLVYRADAQRSRASRKLATAIEGALRAKAR